MKQLRRETGNFNLGTTTAYYKLRQKIKDSKFSIDELDHYNLLLQAGEQEFQLIIVDSKTHRCLLLEHYDLFGIETEEDYLEILEGLFRDHHLLMAGFWNGVKLSVKNQKFSLVPASLFDKEKLGSYLRLSCRIDENNDRLFYYKHSKTHAVTVFAASARLIDWLNGRYPNLGLQVLHHVSALTEGILQYEDHSSQKDVFLMLENNVLSAVVTEGRKLEYCNLFSCRDEKDFVRYVMLLFQQLQLDRSNTKTLLWGNIDTQSPYFQELYPYIRNLSFGGRPKFIRFNYQFDEVLDHQFFDLYSIYVCE